MPAKALLTEPATVLAVWYQAKAEATDFSPPCSAIKAFAEGSRSDMDRPCALRIAKSSHGTLAKPKNSDTKLRRLIAGDSVDVDQDSGLIAITLPGSIRSVLGAKRCWRWNFPESDRDRQGGACCCGSCGKVEIAKRFPRAFFDRLFHCS